MSNIYEYNYNKEVISWSFKFDTLKETIHAILVKAPSLFISSVCQWW